MKDLFIFDIDAIDFRPLTEEEKLKIQEVKENYENRHK